MKENSKEWWEGKYRSSGDQFLYGKSPSEFLIQFSHLFKSNSMLLDLAAGEGRNAVALALKGHRVTAIDFSESAGERAKSLAAASGVELQWKKNDLDLFLPELLTYDGIVSVNFRPAPTLMKNLVRGLKKDGLLLMECFLNTACLERKDIEVFETYRSGELLKFVLDASPHFRVLYYSELGPEANKAYILAKKTEML